MEAHSGITDVRTGGNSLATEIAFRQESAVSRHVRCRPMLKVDIAIPRCYIRANNT